MERNRKKLFGASAAYILGLRPAIEIKGTSGAVSSFRNVLESSRNLYVILHENSTPLYIEEKLLIKKDAARRFYSTTGIQWPF